MARRTLTVDRHEEIKRRLADGRSLREIATALGCSRRLVRQIRDGERLTHETAASPDPLWMAQLEWPVIIHELGLGFSMKDIWDERAKDLITYPNFWKQALTQEAAVTAAAESTRRAQDLYKGGLQSYFNVVEAQNIELASRLSDADIRTRRMTASVLLIKALGGGWQRGELGMGSRESTASQRGER
jgi:hypothetical protein